MKKNTKNHIFTKIWYFSHFFRKTRFFPKNRASSHFSYYDAITSCQISERFHDRFLRKTLNRLTNWRKQANMGEFIKPTSWVCGSKNLVIKAFPPLLNTGFKIDIEFFIRFYPRYSKIELQKMLQKDKISMKIGFLIHFLFLNQTKWFCEQTGHW